MDETWWILTIIAVVWLLNFIIRWLLIEWKYTKFGIPMFHYWRKNWKEWRNG